MINKRHENKEKQTIDLVEFRFVRLGRIQTALDFENKNWSKLSPEYFERSHYIILNKDLYKRFEEKDRGYLHLERTRTSSLNELLSEKDKKKILSLETTEIINTKDASMVKWSGWQSGPCFHLDKFNSYIIMDTAIRQIKENVRVGSSVGGIYIYDEKDNLWKSFSKGNHGEHKEYYEEDYGTCSLEDMSKDNLNEFDLSGNRKIYLLQKTKGTPWPNYTIKGFSDEFDTWFHSDEWSLKQLKNAFKEAKAKEKDK